MNRPLAATVFSVACLASGHSQAVWDYSLVQKLAMFDAVEAVCRPIDKKLFDAAKGRLLSLTNEEKAQMDDARRSDEYAQTLQGVKQELSEMVVGDLPSRRSACKKLLER